MRIVSTLLLVLLSFGALAQTAPVKHPRVVELEEKLTEEASLYFGRRHPGEPFFIKVHVEPLRRQAPQEKKTEQLPYFEADAEEFVDEWDDPTTPLSYLRNRVVKVVVELSIPQSFTDQKVSDLKQELPIYLRLLPYRDEIKVEKKFQAIAEPLPPYVSYLIGGLLAAALVVGLMVRWSFRNLKPTEAPATVAAGPSGMKGPPASEDARPKGSKVHDIAGDVTFHDPLKTTDIVHLKLNQIAQSKTFPTLNDVICLDGLCQRDPARLGALICEVPQDWQHILLRTGNNEKWLEAFASPGRIDQSCLELLYKISRERSFLSGSRELEDLLIQVWRLGDKALAFLKAVDQDHAFLLLDLLPKSVSLGLAKKAFPGAWGKVLENGPRNVVLDAKVISDYQRKALGFLPAFEAKMLDNYKRDREILTYLGTASIESERDIYETLKPESFIHQVRPPFYKVFELKPENLAALVNLYPVEKWALVLMNSSRTYFKQISDCLDEKKKVVFSSHLKRLDASGAGAEEQEQWRRTIAREALERFPKDFEAIDLGLSLKGKGSTGDAETKSA